MELQRFRDYGRQDQETIQYLEKRLAVEQQLGYSEGMAQAARDQFRTTSRGRSPVRYYGDDEYARKLQRAADESPADAVAVFKKFTVTYPNKSLKNLR